MAHENGDASGRVGHVAHGFSSGGSWRDKRRHAVYMPKVPAGSQEVGRHSALAARRLLQALKHLENVDAGPTHVPALQRPPNAAAPRSAAGLLCEIALQYGPGPPRPYAGAKKVCLRQIGSPLRVGREQKRIRSAVESALHRDQIELDVRPAATTADLLDGITKFRPHVVHFSGHSNDDLIVFEDETDEPHEGVIVTARAFARAISATDDPPLLVLLNSCRSAAQIDDLVAQVVPFAIGMADSIEDADAISYAAQFYAAVANGQSINSSHLSGQAALELAGLDSADLPTLAWAPDVDPSTTVLVKPTD